MSNSNTIRGVEIFRSGAWNGDEYSNADLDDMVRNFDRVGFQVPITLGHQKEPGAPAYGWVKHIRRVGDKLVADFRDLPKKLVDMIRQGRFGATSAEIFWNLERNGKKFRRVLKAVALLGAETPAVSGLAPLQWAVASNTITTFDRVTACTFNLSGEGEHQMTQTEEATPSAKINRLARAYIYDHPQIAFPMAVEMVMSAHPNLAHLYACEVGGGVRTYSDQTAADPAAELDQIARRLCDENETLTFSEAARIAIRENPDIGSKWAQKTYPGPGGAR